MNKLKFNKPESEIYIPQNIDEDTALKRTTHLAIGAHQDDLEIMAYHGIAECYKSDEEWFSGVVVTNGAGSARTGKYQSFSNEEMMQIRKEEQNKAAEIGNYSVQIQLGYPSAEIKDPKNKQAIEDILKILTSTKPNVVYVHNPADKHDAHIGTMAKTIEAIKMMPKNERPSKVYGCEVWRDLDWLPDDEKVALEVDKYPELADEILKVFDSQIAGGKRYDLATIGRRLSHATYHASHSVDACSALTFAIDLTPCVTDEIAIKDLIMDKINKFKSGVEEKLQELAN